jgi:hypothetical protein
MLFRSASSSAILAGRHERFRNEVLRDEQCIGFKKVADAIGPGVGCVADAEVQSVSKESLSRMEVGV